MGENAMVIELEVNGMKHRVHASARETLLDLLRDKLGLKGVKRGCSAGQCGSCTVIMNGKAVNACLVPAVRVHGKRIATVEGLEGTNGLHPLQKAFVRNGAVQCGFCTSGMLMSAKALLDADSSPDRKKIKESLSGNLCRCSGYKKIIDAVEAVSENDV
jgi:aerobic-type carbon monoxide dehydrogenase small subunit (CoxS/CutS family)